MDKNLLTVAVMEALEKADGCCLCYLWKKDEERQVNYLLTNERSMDPEFRMKLLEAHGFCNRHMYLLYRTAYAYRSEDGLVYATYMQSLVEAIIKLLESLPPYQPDDLRKQTKGNVFRRGKGRQHSMSVLANLAANYMRQKAPCPACEYLGRSAETHLKTFIGMLAGQDFAREFAFTAGLCLPHFAAAMQAVVRSGLRSSGRVAQILVETEMKYLKLTEHYLSEFIRKKSYEFKNEPRGEEINANVMALRLVAGAEGSNS